jgi:hypothetical protein
MVVDTSDALNALSHARKALAQLMKMDEKALEQFYPSVSLIEDAIRQIKMDIEAYERLFSDSDILK